MTAPGAPERGMPPGPPEVTVDAAATPPRPPERLYRRPGTRRWRLSWRGLRSVAVLELRQRVRTARWVLVLVIWAAVVGLATALVRHSALHAAQVGEAAGDAQAGGDVAAGRMMLGVIVFLVLTLGSLIAPALSSTSVNGARATGVLPTLQTTLLSAAEIAFGKLLASWVTALALLATALPFIGWAWAEGGIDLPALLLTLGLLAVALLVLCAIGLGWSTLTGRTSSSAALTYLTVALLGPGLPLLFTLATPLVEQQDRVPVAHYESAAGTTADQQPPATFEVRCLLRIRPVVRAHTERIWWLLAPSPYVMVSDAAPRVARPAPIERLGPEQVTRDPLTSIRHAVQQARRGPTLPDQRCTGALPPVSPQTRNDASDAPLTWPLGLAAELLVGGGFMAAAVHRLTAPTRRPVRGLRVA